MYFRPFIGPGYNTLHAYITIVRADLDRENGWLQPFWVSAYFQGRTTSFGGGGKYLLLYKMIYFKTWMISNHEPVCFQ